MTQITPESRCAGRLPLADARGSAFPAAGNRAASVSERQAPRFRQAGVTLIEMLVVVMIIALFAAIASVAILGKAEVARTKAAQTQIDTFMTALAAYRLDTGSFPTTEQGLAALMRRPDSVPNWDGPYLTKEIPRDPWGRAYLYRHPGELGDLPAIVSLGADGQPGGQGVNQDIVSWRN